MKSSMKSTYLVAAALLALIPVAGVTFAATDDQGGAPTGNQTEPHSRFTSEDRAAFLDARVAALKAGLELNADQEKNWPALEAAIRDLAKERAERMKAWREKRDEGQHVDAMERLTLMSDRLERRAANIKKLEAAAKPLYDSLDDAQKGRFGVLLASAIGHSHHHWRHEG